MCCTTSTFTSTYYTYQHSTGTGTAQRRHEHDTAQAQRRHSAGTALRSTAPHRTAPHRTALHCTVGHCIVQLNAKWGCNVKDMIVFLASLTELLLAFRGFHSHLVWSELSLQVKVFDLSKCEASDDDVLIMASDGLWERVTNTKVRIHSLIFMISAVRM